MVNGEPYMDLEAVLSAPSAWREPNDACCRQAFSEARSARMLLERALQKPAFVMRHAAEATVRACEMMQYIVSSHCGRQAD
jgi:hypothetical protein